MKVTCQHCNATFNAKPVEIARGRGRYCSMPCYQAGRVRPLSERFWAKVQKGDGDGCWLWIGGRSPRGYGHIGSGGPDWKHLGTHRLSYELAYGPIPDGMQVLHTCDNPPCVRPDHLFLGDNSDNANDSVRKGRRPVGDQHWTRRFPERLLRGDDHPGRKNGANLVRGEDQSLAKLTDTQVREIRSLYETGLISQRRLARAYEVTQPTIKGVVGRKTWKHID